MIDYNSIKRVYFLGIGGIGMSALARYFHSRGMDVGGYDKTNTKLTREMESEGIAVHYVDDVSLADKEAQLVVYTPAIPGDSKELKFFQDNSYLLHKRSAVLGAITANSYSICVAGTHGKTTISTMIAHLLRNSGYGCNAFLGGISVNYNTNFWASENNVSVSEADEYDRSFLALSPDIAVISSMDADHLDIYGTKENMEDAFIAFSRKLKTNGLLITKYGLSRTDMSATNHIRYSLQNDQADTYASDITLKNGGYKFNVVSKNWTLQNVTLHMGGMHNVENAVAAIYVAKHLEITDDKIINALASFKGVKRRFEYVIPPLKDHGPKDNYLTGMPVPKRQVIFIDDYAHHPQELEALIKSAKSLFSERRCTVIFQPHLFSRTQDFANEFAHSLDLADETLLLPIYPAREKPIPGVTAELIADKMKSDSVHLFSKEELLNFLRTTYSKEIDSSVNGELLITAGAGDIDMLLEEIKEIVLNS